MTTEHSKADLTREKIMRCAIHEFAFQIYNKASTNHIVAEADVAKGLLFHYFPSKQKLYLACLESVLQEIQQPLNAFMQQMSPDIFSRLKDFLIWKHTLSRENPLLFRFLMNIAKIPTDLRAKADDILTTWRKSNGQLMQDYDKDLWDPCVDQPDALAVIVLLFDAFDQRWLMQMDAVKPPDPQQSLNHALRLLDVLKTGFYRKIEA